MSELAHTRAVVLRAWFAIAIVASIPATTDAQVQEDKGLCYDRDLAVAIAACSRLIERVVEGDDLFNAYLNRGNAYFLKRDYDDATADYSEAIRRFPKYMASYSNRAAVYLEIGQLDRAIADYDYVIDETPDFTGAYSGRGRAFEAKGAIDLAIPTTKRRSNSIRRI